MGSTAATFGGMVDAKLLKDRSDDFQQPLIRRATLPVVVWFGRSRSAQAPSKWLIVAETSYPNNSDLH